MLKRADLSMMCCCYLFITNQDDYKISFTKASFVCTSDLSFGYADYDDFKLEDDSVASENMALHLLFDGNAQDNSGNGNNGNCRE